MGGNTHIWRPIAEGESSKGGLSLLIVERGKYAIQNRPNRRGVTSSKGLNPTGFSIRKIPSKT